MGKTGLEEAGRTTFSGRRTGGPAALWRRAGGLLLGSMLLSGPALAQRYVLPTGEYMDTAQRRNNQCPAVRPYYYSVNGKYPRSSATLRSEVQAFLRQRAAPGAGSGYVTFRFVVDCAGQPDTRVQVLQTDAQYRPHHFAPAYVAELYAFVRTLRDWRVGKHPNGTAVSYTALITFKITDGEVVAVLP